MTDGTWGVYTLTSSPSAGLSASFVSGDGATTYLSFSDPATGTEIINLGTAGALFGGEQNNARLDTDNWQGAIADVVVYNRVFSPAEITANTAAFNALYFEATTNVLGDFDGDGVVDCTDLDGYVNNIGAAATGALAQLDIDGDGTLSATDANTHITTLVVTSNGVTGTFPGDLNCDGEVNVLGDAFALVSSLNTSVTTYAQGDINFDGMVNVLGDAFALVSNLGMSNSGN